MKRIALITLIALTMIGLFAANQTRLLAKSSSTITESSMMNEKSSSMAAETMFTASQLYEMGQFTQAAQAYQQLADQGFADSALFYNLGNAYYKQGDYGRAVLNYRRAQQLAPRDPDIEANLTFARAQAVDQFEAIDGDGAWGQLGQAMQDWFTLNELAMAALGMWILFAFLLLLYGSAQAGGTWRKGLQYALVATAVVLAVSVLALGSYLHMGNSQSEGVIVTAEVDVTSGPGAQYVTEFTLHRGAEVDLVEVRGNWVRLALPGGELEGWIPASSVEAVTG
jgi:tetratricopeptide (TPR) repeat protein